MLRNPVEASSRTCSAKAIVNANQGRPKPDTSGDVACIMASTSGDYYAPGVHKGRCHPAPRVWRRRICAIAGSANAGGKQQILQPAKNACFRMLSLGEASALG